jgi:hypothetical protein
MPNDFQIPEMLRLILRDRQRERSPEEENAARRFLLDPTRANLAELIAAPRPD